jgi:hypothetical protein
MVTALLQSVVTDEILMYILLVMSLILLIYSDNEK